jgi:DNA polymerase-3 subunit beta
MDGSAINTTQRATVDSADLRKALEFVVWAQCRHSSIPILRMVRIVVADGRMTLSCSDLDNFADAWLPVEEGEADFATTIRPRFLQDALRHHSGPVTISHDVSAQGDRQTTIQSGELRAVARELCPAGDFPAMPDGGTPIEPFDIAGGQLHRALSAVAGCISTEETRYYLNGVYLHPHQDCLRAVATDGHRLAMLDLPDTRWLVPALILPRWAVGILRAHLKRGANADIRISGQTTQQPPIERDYVKFICFEGDGWRLTSKTIDGTYPAYTKVIPERGGDISVTLSYDALRRLPRPSFGLSRALKIDPTAGRMTIADFSDGVEASMPIQGTGPTFGLNIEYLQSFARGASVVRIEGKRPSDPMHILTEDPNLTQILMPMRV